MTNLDYLIIIYERSADTEVKDTLFMFFSASLIVCKIFISLASK